ncbi:MAG: formylglycine-generating enzyme family protein, partial [Trichodesmium sp. St18_bin1]|nr:formylglycine-generating enzyme family protein [Trichodesmium sp. St18_bin1]
NYRLPSEAEWEYACRAGTTTPFYFGETITTELVNYDGNYTYGNAPKGEYRKQTTPVGQFPPNAFGLYDMHGNVWELCADDWQSDYTVALNKNNTKHITKVIRGCSWESYPRRCRSAVRDNFFPDEADFYDIGFRLVSSPPLQDS